MLVNRELGPVSVGPIITGSEVEFEFVANRKGHMQDCNMQLLELRGQEVGAYSYIVEFYKNAPKSEGGERVYRRSGITDQDGVFRPGPNLAYHLGESGRIYGLIINGSGGDRTFKATLTVRVNE